MLKYITEIHEVADKTLLYLLTQSGQRTISFPRPYIEHKLFVTSITCIITLKVRQPRVGGTAAITFQRIIGGFTHNAGHPN